jgi:L-proline amide hydrolase
VAERVRIAAIEEGYIPFLGHRVWYRSVGIGHDPALCPLLAVHGGPGATHRSLRSLEALAEDGRRVVFYDQLGCGRSDRPEEPVGWSITVFLDELAAVRRALGLRRVHILGHSWGGMLALEHVLSGGEGVCGLVLASSPVNMRQWVREARRLREHLPEDVRVTLDEHELAGTTDDGAYYSAMLEYYRRHVCRLDPWPPEVVDTMLELFNNPHVYRVMNGPSEFHVTGVLRDWDVVRRLPGIRLPVLITSGRYDEATPVIARTAYRGIRGSRWVVFEQSAHMPHLEEPVAYLACVRRFLQDVEAR